MLDSTKPTAEQVAGNGSHGNGHDNGTNGEPGAALRLRDVALTDNARVVLEKRYLRRGPDGKPVETIPQMFWRVAHHVARSERDWGGSEAGIEEQFYDLLTSLRFFPNSPTFTGAGTPLGQLAACFVLKIEDDMGRSEAGIFQTLRDAALIQQTGGGNGFAFSRLRPKASLVKTSAGSATGPVGFLRVYDKAFGEVAQGGCLLPETLVFTDHGLLRLDEIADKQTAGWQSHDMQVATDEGWRPSPRAYNNGVAPVLRVHTRAGVSIAGTAEHRVKIMTAAGPDWRMLKDLRQGDWVIVQLGQHQGKLQVLRQPRHAHGNQVWPKLPSVLDEELAFFLGYLAGDGFVATKTDDRRLGVSVAHNSHLMVEMPALMQRLFGVTVHEGQKENDRSITLVIDNRAVKDFFQLNGLDKSRSRTVCVPRLIRQSPPEVVGAYLRGLFEADGGLSHGYPELSTTSPQLAEEVATLLIGLGCPVRLWSLQHGVNHYGGARMYRLRIESSVGLQAWRQRIGCDPRSRFVAAQSWEADLGRESTFVLPHSRYWFEPVLEAITHEQVDARGRGLGRNFRSQSPELRRSLLRYARGDRSFTRSAYDELSRTHAEFAAHARLLTDRWFVQVEGVEVQGEALTLDLEVAENHTYLANGVVTHNTRRGANMAVLRCDHPDVEEFITCKIDENAITNFNISVGITDAFMRAVKNDEMWDLRFPDVGAPEYRQFNGTLEDAERQGLPIRVYKALRARELFDKIVHQAHHNGEPGVLFLDAANRENPVPHLYPLEATNPCGEQYLGPYENCCLGSINLAQHLAPDGKLDWEKLRESTVLSTRFLDDVVTANAYVPAVPQLRKAAMAARRIGLGIMGLGDAMFHAGVRYGSDEAQEFAAQVMEFVRYHCMLTSVELSKQRGPFDAIAGSLYDPKQLQWSPPAPLAPYGRDYGRPTIDWQAVVDGILAHGIRNACQTTVAPTGTIATVAGCEAYGCEPAFALAYIRHVNDHGRDLKLTYTSPMFERALIDAGVDDATRARIIEQVLIKGSCQDIAEVPPAVRHAFVVSQDITADEHVRMQAALQRFVDNSLSKTCNFPPEATEQDVAQAYLLAWELGCKGMTVYVTGSRDKVVLETHATAQAKTTAQAPVPAPVATPAPAAAIALAPAAPVPVTMPMFHESKKPRPTRLRGSTIVVTTPLGKSFVTVNENGGQQPFEVFITTAKAGSETAAISEAIGRLISYILRLASPLAPRERLQEVMRQLGGIGTGRSIGFGPNRVASLPDGVARALAEYLGDPDSGPALAGSAPEAAQSPSTSAVSPAHSPSQLSLKIGDICPECGEASLVNEEGCRKCYSCGFSQC